VTDPYVEAQQSPFANLNVNMNTAALWGKRVHSVGVSESVIFALSDTGDDGGCPLVHFSVVIES
jgi:hypothetical protein